MALTNYGILLVKVRAFFSDLEVCDSEHGFFLSDSLPVVSALEHSVSSF
jgi:hypothetical protein